MQQYNKDHNLFCLHLNCITYQKIDLIVDFVDIAFNAIFIVIIIATNVQ